MKRTFYLAVFTVVMLALFGSAGAVEKTKRDTASIKVESPIADTGQAAGRPSTDKKRLDPNLNRSKYDNFIDVDNNGIDDRAEKQCNTKPKKEPVTDSISAKPPKK